MSSYCSLTFPRTIIDKMMSIPLFQQIRLLGPRETGEVARILLQTDLQRRAKVSMRNCILSDPVAEWLISHLISTADAGTGPIDPSLSTSSAAPRTLFCPSQSRKWLLLTLSAPHLTNCDFVLDFIAKNVSTTSRYKRQLYARLQKHQQKRKANCKMID